MSGSLNSNKQTGPVWRVYVMHVAMRDQYESDQHTRGCMATPRNGRFSTRHRLFLILRIAAVTSRRSEGEMIQVFPARKRKNDGS